MMDTNIHAKNQIDRIIPSYRKSDLKLTLARYKKAKLIPRFFDFSKNRAKN